MEEVEMSQRGELTLQAPRKPPLIKVRGEVVKIEASILGITSTKADFLVGSELDVGVGGALPPLISLLRSSVHLRCLLQGSKLTHGGWLPRRGNHAATAIHVVAAIGRGILRGL